jgi:hypothetical protein
MVGRVDALFRRVTVNCRFRRFGIRTDGLPTDQRRVHTTHRLDAERLSIGLDEYVDRTRPARNFVAIGIVLQIYVDATVHEILGTPKSTHCGGKAFPKRPYNPKRGRRVR